ncbi:Conserved membrane protein [Phytophthora cinnamomi]|uniref:Conserved membrane protein n=1 Tax=Phytophthora cinnamomi TaxID=4785 RepID=UPI00355A266F|nr:Conserved membrane protein [Phytophthora cinnamomi]
MLDLHALLGEERDLDAVPVLDEASFRLGAYRDGSTLKFRGVVRDVQDPELVLLGGEAPAALEDGEAMRRLLVERVPLTVTLFPHVSDWAARAYQRDVSLVKNGEESDGRCSPSDGKKATKGTKRPAHEQQALDDVDVDTQDETHAKKPKAETEQEQEKLQQEESLLRPQAVNIYVYDGQYKDTPLDAFKVNEAFEFVGILDLVVPGTDTKKEEGEGVLSTKQLEELQISDCIDEVQRKARSGVVLHCCHVSALQSVHHVRPHESSEYYQQIHESNDSRTKFCRDEWTKLGQEMTVAAMRQQVIGYLSKAVRGDTLAAEYLLLGLLSHVYSRADPSTPLGNLSLNLSLDKSSTEGQKSSFISQVQQTLKSLMPMVARVDLSLKELNSTKFMPHKDYEREVLVSGVLQVANGTTMLVNETALTAGQLNDQGVKNIAALQSLIDKMLLPYDFHYYNMDFPQDVAVVTVSEGKSILPVTVAVPIVAADISAAEEQTASLPQEQVLECFRVFLSVLRSFVVTIGNEEAEMAEKHYVECRKSQQKVALEDLHRWLRLARLVALSRGEGQISKNSWDAMLTLENQRLARSPADNSSS